METLRIAQIWHSLGIATIPCLAHSKVPALDSWRKYQEYLPTMRELSVWFSRPGYNLAVVTGWQGLVVLDFDDMWQHSLWLAQQDSAIVSTYKVRTMRGIHIYLRSRSDAAGVRTTICDVKARGGYVLAPPSIHPSGFVYAAIGSPLNIMHIDSLDGLLPRVPPIEAQDRCEDSFDLAMHVPFPTGTIEAIKARVTFADLLNQNGRRGVWLAVCPLHSDTIPSLAVYPDGHGHCFGCGWHGDVIDLYAAMHHVSVQTAIAEMKGVSWNCSEK